MTAMVQCQNPDKCGVQSHVSGSTSQKACALHGKNSSTMRPVTAAPPPQKTRRTTVKTTPQAISDRVSFKYTSSLTGEVFPDGSTSPNYRGELGDEDAAALREAEEIGIKYLVTSYSTPIAWETVNGDKHFVEHRFSKTTSRHQSFIRQSNFLDD